MLKIRLQRVGRKNDPSFRVVVTDSKNGPQSGKFLEVLGSYNARFGKPLLNNDRIKHWITMGAGVSDTVHNMLVRFKVISGDTVNVLGPKPVKPEEPQVEVSEKVAAVEAVSTEEVTEVENVSEEPSTEEASVTEPVPEVLAETESTTI